MEYAKVNWEKKEDVAGLYGLTTATLRNYEKRGAVAPPWRDPWKLLEWYRVTVRREPKQALQDRVRELGAEITGMGDYDEVVVGDWVPLEEAFNLGGTTDNTDGADGDKVDKVDKVEGVEGVEGAESVGAVMARVCGDVGLGVTLARVVDEERRAFEAYEAKREDAGLREDWLDCVKVKREYSKTQDAVEAALKLLQHWVRGEWEAQWKQLRQRLGGRMLGVDARAVLMAAAPDEVEWRRVWDMEMERAICEWEDADKNNT